MDRSQPIETRNPYTEPAEVWWVLFDGRELTRIYGELRADNDPIFAPLDVERFESVFSGLQELIRTRTPGYEARAFAALATLLGELFAARAPRQLPSIVAANGRPLSQALRKAHDYIAKRHGDNSLNADNIAEAASLSARQLSRLFTAELGCTPMHYLRRFRIQHACDLLETSDYPVRRIAEIVGAGNASHFTYLFRRLTGTTPAAHRAAARATAAT
jgi:transcriptional regulator GlxA family with amidase domain